MNWKLTIAGLGLLATGCATQPSKIQGAYVSELQYKDYDCDQLAAESGRINRRAYELYANLKKTADNDEAQMGVGIILLWPTLFFLEGGDGPEAQEYARLKGERNTIESVAIQKKCGIEFKKFEPEPTVQAEVKPKGRRED
ncbi:MAG: hypothetical protein A2516_04795 [Alphaproteobacteria bacterium RIFOXYD12_FULL_60_8]|nr:MAG: hypothetical protein A2516_04795 [Alphaproteobacteria bacterium RIFOXYD12_FULL_60_8]